MAVAFQHATADVPGNRHDRGVGRAILRKLSDGAVSQVVEPEARQAGFLRQRPPRRPPAGAVPQPTEEPGSVRPRLVAVREEKLGVGNARR